MLSGLLTISFYPSYKRKGIKKEVKTQFLNKERRIVTPISRNCRRKEITIRIAQPNQIQNAGFRRTSDLIIDGDDEEDRSFLERREVELALELRRMQLSLMSMPEQLQRQQERI